MTFSDSDFLGGSDSDFFDNSNFLVDSDSAHLDDSDYLQGDSDNKHMHSISLDYINLQYANNPFNYIQIFLSIDVWTNTTGCVVEKMQHLKAGRRWSAYRSPLLHSWF